MVSILHNNEAWEPDSDLISYDDTIHGRRLAELDGIMAASEVEGRSADVVREDDVAWLAANDLFALPPFALKWLCAGSIPGEMYRYLHNVGGE